MDVASAAKLFASNTLWRSTGLKAAGRTLVRALDAEDEDLRGIASALLIRAGRQAEPLLRDAMTRRENLPIVLMILTAIEGRNIEPELRLYSNDPDPSVAETARDALHVFEAESKLPELEFDT